MLSDLMPLGLSAAARRIGLDPFELVRLLVATDGVPADLTFQAERIDALANHAGVEPSWWTNAELPEDNNPRRQRVRGAIRLLLERGHIGGEGTRMDNVWRGLSADDQLLVRDALYGLADDGLVALMPGKMGTRVAVNPASEDRVRQIADGLSDTSSLSVLYGV